ncbi:signal recognition particle-docking protein FtsY [Phormidium sp. FACHB-1136]|uniref:signal recognition particle-docking protein FtsY n=1 Tax=Phormidium sp. FACHB-1136 TaxID=2692848 RepID=UPI0016847A38|nr:signal recognition particle-docking protein FtsY [Phormidium sp. FACHB-1136]MBD2425738.1 signal recognition particle-docking protein FtsY [Phormidium sp. FACHB-1136]
MVFNWFRRGFEKSDAAKAEPKPTETVTPEPTPEKAEAEAPAAPKSLAEMTPEEKLAWAKAAAQNIQKQQAEAKAVETPTEPAPEPAAVEPEAETRVESAESAESVTPEPAEDRVAETAAVESVVEPEPAVIAEVEPEVAPEAESVIEELILEESAADASESEAAVPEEETSEEPAAVVAESPSEAEISVTESVDEPVTEAVAESEIEPVAEAGAESSVAEPVAAPVAEPEPQASVPFWARAEEERLQRLERLQETAIVEPEPEPEPVAAVTTPELILPDIDLDEAFLWSAEVLAAQGRRPDEISAEEITWLKRLRQGLSKTRLSLVNQLKAIVGQGPLNEDAVMEIEALLLQADVGVAATDKVIEALQNRMRNEVLPPDQAIAYLKTILRDMLDAPLGDSHNLLFVPEKETLNIWLMTGVNGAGKTTTIGKLAHVAKKSGYNTLIAAADTFRAAAVEQVKAWGARSEVEVIANPGKNTDPAAVVYDAIAAANSRQIDLLLVDTAGRLQNKKNLMDELAKIRRIVDKNAPNAKIEALLVLDATLGQNGLRQAEVFAEAANLSGVVLTKLDGTAKGGVALAVVEQLGLPIRFIGAGEGIEDLRPFSSYEFIEALLSG